ncbi:putative hexose transport-related protein [Mrakia frigida]|uniref:putative hexose transport-related protein n=1 Tax=Mrakia frigida TaxID=29902 RepID=UPI003FCC081D
MSGSLTNWRAIPNAADNLKWYQNKGALKLNYFLSLLFVGMVLNGYDGTLLSGLQALDAWHADLGNPSAGKIGVLNAAGAISGLVVGPFITWVDERFGRRWGIRFYGYTILTGSVIGCVAGLPGVDGYALFLTSRFIIGFGLASFLMTSLVVVQEITHPRSRAAIAASWDSYWILGSVIASWVVFGTSYLTTSWSWRIPYIIQVPLALYILIGVQFVPETPRFLFANGREEEALQFFIEFHGNGNPDDELVLFEFDEMKETLRLEKELKADKWKTIVKSKGSLHRMGLAALMAFMTGLSGASIVYYYYTVVLTMVGITNATTQTGIGAGISMWTWAVQICGVLVGKRVDSKRILLTLWPCILIALVGMCVASGVFANSDSMNNQAAIATVAMLWIYQGFFNFTNPVLYSYPAEVQTYSTRSKGLLVWNTCSQLFSIYTTYVDSIALDRIGYKYYIVYMPLIVIQWCLAYCFMVKTHSYTLEEVAEAFDGPEGAVTRLDKLWTDRNPSGRAEREADQESGSKKSEEQQAGEQI